MLEALQSMQYIIGHSNGLLVGKHNHLSINSMSVVETNNLQFASCCHDVMNS